MVHVYKLSFSSGGGGGRGGVTAKVDDCRTMVLATRSDIFNKTSGHFPPVFVATKLGTFNQRLEHCRTVFLSI